jgi:hypothetical protein
MEFCWNFAIHKELFQHWKQSWFLFGLNSVNMYPLLDHCFDIRYACWHEVQHDGKWTFILHALSYLLNVDLDLTCSFLNYYPPYEMVILAFILLDLVRIKLNHRIHDYFGLWIGNGDNSDINEQKVINSGFMIWQIIQ